jgi:transglutaminase-like putative cysteine protease
MLLSSRVFSLMAAALLGALLPYALWLPLSTTLLVGSLLAVRIASYPRRPRIWPLWLRFPAMLLLVASIVLEMGTILGRPQGGALLAAMLALKTTEASTVRDARLIVSLALFSIVALLFIDQSPWLVAYQLPVAVLCFYALEEIARLDAGQSELRRFAWQRLLALLRVTALALPIAALAWLLLPRLAEPLWGSPNAQATRTGLSDSMSPGDFNELFGDETPAFRVSFLGPEPPYPSLYWRGPVLWHYDGRTWRNRMPLRAYDELRAADDAVRPDDVHYEVILEPTERRWLFLLDLPIATNVEATLTLDRQVVVREPIMSLMRYEGYSRLRPLEQERYPNQQRRWGLQWPEDADGRRFNPRTWALGQTLKAEFPDDPRARVRALLERFRQEDYYYSLSPPPLGRDAMDDFLFVTRNGYCEHYSSAFVSVMRAAGVPARVVTGYFGGVRNRIHGYYVVRHADAHAWAEVWLPPGRWERVDPTAAVAPERVLETLNAGLRRPGPELEGGLWLALAERLDGLRMWWNRAVIGFGYRQQLHLLDRLGIEQGSWRELALLFSTVLALASVIALYLLWRWERPASADRLAQGYRRLRRRLEQNGIAVALGEGPRHLRGRLDPDRGPWYRELFALLEEYERLRYAIDPTPAEVERWRARLARLPRRP